jgi:hypothetical protein
MPLEAEVSASEIPKLTSEVAAEYAKRSRPTLARDLVVLSELGLVAKSSALYKANIDSLRTLAPASTGRIE